MTLRPVVCFAGRVAKNGNQRAECEDAVEVNLDTGHFAVADGATEASYSQQWADILVRAFPKIDSPQLDRRGFEAWLDGCQREWAVWAASLSSKSLPWFTQEKLNHGSFATFVGLCFQSIDLSEDSLIWHAVACGDSCLFVVQDDAVLRETFPIREPEEFNQTPPLLCTSGPPSEEWLRFLSGSGSSSDRMYLATDALAKWFIESYESLGKPWRQLDLIQTEDELGVFVGELRAANLIRNDDVALVRITFEPS